MPLSDEDEDEDRLSQIELEISNNQSSLIMLGCSIVGIALYLMTNNSYIAWGGTAVLYILELTRQQRKK